METILSFVYPAMWFLIGIGIIYVGKKNNFGVVTPAAAIMFFFMAFWWLFDAILDVDMLSGNFGWVFRIIMAVFVLIIILLYLNLKKKRKD
ncbi:MAG: hypothetical protein J1F17_02305 [Oscillospiraceae bacterium]|nr:hypothetical protein [Oscillospiraceae bacterium]